MTLVIDGSHSRVEELDTAIIRYAVRNYGMTLNEHDAALLERGEADARELVSGLDAGDAEELRWLADEAVEYLNDHVPAYVWWVEESSLWFEDRDGCCCGHEDCSDQ